MTPDWPKVRAEFPALNGRAFLNTATFGQLPQRGMDAIVDHLRHRTETACGDFLSWFDDHDRLRGKLSRLIHGEADDIAFVPNASAALGLLTSGITWKQGDEVVTLEGEFPNNIYAPHFLAARGIVPRETTWDRLFETVNDRTRLLALSTVNYVTGFRPPLEQISAECLRRGILLYIDGTQSLGAFRFDFGRLQPAMLAVNCYKWMLAPNGAAFFAIRKDVRDQIDPISIGWRSDRDWRNVDHLHHGAPRLRSSAEKYEGGMLPSTALYALEASVDLQFELTPEAIEERVLLLAGEAGAILEKHGGRIANPATAVLAAEFPGRDASQLARDLKVRNIIVSARHGFLRVSTHYYNDASDLAALGEALHDLIG